MRITMALHPLESYSLFLKLLEMVSGFQKVAYNIIGSSTSVYMYELLYSMVCPTMEHNRLLIEHVEGCEEPEFFREENFHQHKTA
jgi:hypothetical protein